MQQIDPTAGALVEVAAGHAFGPVGAIGADLFVRLYNGLVTAQAARQVVMTRDELRAEAVRLLVEGLPDPLVAAGG